MARIEITAETDAKLYWIAVDDQDVDMRNGFGSIAVPAGKHMLHWGMHGAAGNTLSVRVTHNDSVLVEVDKDPIPDGWDRGGGLARFEA